MVGLTRHLARSRRNWRHRVLIMVDSMAALGIISKGRSSSPVLLRLSRQLAAVSLAFGLLLFVRYIPLQANPSDGPSRGQGVGAAPETQAVHADRLHEGLRTKVEWLPLVAAGAAAPPQEVADLLSRARVCAGSAGG